MKKLADDWMMLAEKDVKTASIIINEEYLTNVVAFHCQQAIENILRHIF
jgi:HEPN domain-containing protein